MPRRSLTLPIIILLLFILVGLDCLSIQKVSAATDAVQVNLSVTASTPPSGGGPTSVPGCTNPLATNYNPAATVDNGSCILPPTPVLGCTNPLAPNYNPLATQDDGSCLPLPPETIPNVTGFATSFADPNVHLTWQNPSFATFSGVRIVRGTGTIPTSPTDGNLIYDGSGTQVTDSDVIPDTQYYYVAFVRNASDIYSSGSLTSIRTPATNEELPPDDQLPPDENPPPGTEPDNPLVDNAPGGRNDPFASLPSITPTDPITQLINLGDFIFYQPGERQQFFAGNQDISVLGLKPLSVLISSGKLPEALKIIGLTIINPATNKPLGTYLLKATADGRNYTASLGNAFPNGIYPLFISIINYKDQTMKRLAGRLVVSNGLLATPIAKTIAVAQQVLSPVVVTVGLASGVAQGLVLVDRVSSVYDLYLIFLHGWALLLRALGLRRKVTPWGVVYDSVTKRPLDPAYVIIRKNGEDTGTAITDLDGRYGFFLPANTYDIIANKTHYQFPSKKLVGRDRDELYSNLYFGESFTTQEGELVNRNIPLDPIAFDWNEFAKQSRGFFILHSRRQTRRRRIFNTLYVIGFAIGLYNFIFHPGKLSIVVFALYLITFLARYIKYKTTQRALTVKRQTGEPVPFAIIRAFIPDVNQEIKSVVADTYGRFFLLTPPGRYYITVEEKLPDETYKKIYQSPPIDLKNGVLTNDLVVV